MFFPFNRLSVKMTSDLFNQFYEIGVPPSPPGTSFLVTEGAIPDRLITESTDNYIVE